MAQAPRNKLCLAAFCRQNALQAKKRDIFPAGKVWFSPSAPPADISAQRKFVNLARKQRARDKFILLFRLYMDQKRGYRGFQASANSHEIRCEHHLVASLFVCKKFLLIDRL